LLPAHHAHLPCTTLLNSEECALSEKKKKKTAELEPLVRGLGRGEIAKPQKLTVFLCRPGIQHFCQLCTYRGFSTIGELFEGVPKSLSPPAKSARIKHEKYDCHLMQYFFSPAISFWASLPISLDCLGNGNRYSLWSRSWSLPHRCCAACARIIITWVSCLRPAASST